MLPSLEELVKNYGYWAIFIGTFFEGETILVLGGLFAYQGHLDLATVMLVAFSGTVTGDQLFFYLGRRHSEWILNLRPKWQPRIRRALQLLHRYQDFFMLTFRFYYGLRAVIPFTLGLSQIKPSRFVVFNFIGAVIWAIAVGYLGFLFGEAVTIILKDIDHYGRIAALVAVVIGIAIWIYFVMRSRFRRKAHALKEKIIHHKEGEHEGEKKD